MFTLAAIRHRNRQLPENDSAALHDMGYGVLLFEACSKMKVFEQAYRKRFDWLFD